MFMRKFLILILTLICVDISSSWSQDFKVITFNIRQDLKRDSINRWENRRGLMARFLKDEDSDIVCMQEVLNRQLLNILSDVPFYDYVGVGREDGKTKGEYSPILYKKDRLELIDSGTFALSETPDSIGTLGWDARYSRIATWANLRFKESDEVLFVINTHLDNAGRLAKINGMKLILDTIQNLARSEHVLLTGDFNSDESSEVYRVPSNSKLIDTYHETHNAEGVSYSFHNFGKTNKNSRRKIDFIFASPDIEVENVNIPEERPVDGIYMSDHNPVICMLEISSSMTIDDMLKVISDINEESYGTLNKILRSLQKQGILNFNESALEKLF